MTTTDTSACTRERTRLIEGLRSLADFLAEHPDLPVNTWASVSYHPDGDDDAERAEVDRVAAILGVTPTSRAQGAHYLATKHFGPVEYQAVAITAAHMAEHEAASTYYGAVTP